MASKKILVVDDSCLFQRLLSEVVNEHEMLEVVGVAGNGKVALKMMEELSPDLVTLDILMPEMDGIQTLIQIRKRWPNVLTIMASSLTSEGSDVALDALALGASDYSVKPGSGGGISDIRARITQDLLPKIEALCGLEKIQAPISPIATKLPGRATVKPARSSVPNALQIVAIGVSTGGPDALTNLLSQLPGDLNVPVVIVQHMPAAFTTKLAMRLNTASKLQVREALSGDKLCAGTVYIAPGDYHMVLDKSGSEVIVNLNQNEPENSCRPSVDPLFRSIPAIYGSRCLGVILTGMGQDGLNGSEALVAAGCPVVVQDKLTSIVWGMPKLVAMAGLADEEIPIDRMAAAIVSRIRGQSGSGRERTLTATSAANENNYKQVNDSGRRL